MLFLKTSNVAKGKDCFRNASQIRKKNFCQFWPEGSINIVNDNKRNNKGIMAIK